MITKEFKVTYTYRHYNGCMYGRPPTHTAGSEWKGHPCTCGQLENQIAFDTCIKYIEKLQKKLNFYEKKS